MNVAGRSQRTIWLSPDGASPEIIDQTALPHRLVVRKLATVDEVAEAIRSMRVRGAPLIGVAAAYGLALAAAADPSDAALDRAAGTLLETRPTAVNLRWALGELRKAVDPLPVRARAAAAYARAAALADEDVAACRAMGGHGVGFIRDVWEKHGRSRPVNVLTHCNAGWLATVDWGTALAPVYLAHRQGIPVHVWVDETRPRNQGVLTAWELAQEGVPHSLVVDNAGGHLMQTGAVDLCITGTDRTTRAGDVCNKIGTYLKALAAFDNRIPFYVACPSSSLDWTIAGGSDIPIEERSADEVLEVRGRTAENELAVIRIAGEGTRARNHAFDVTPARLVTAIITDRGVSAANEAALRALYPEVP